MQRTNKLVVDPEGEYVLEFNADSYFPQRVWLPFDVALRVVQAIKDAREQIAKMQDEIAYLRTQCHSSTNGEG